MERLVKARKPIRASFMKTSSEICELINSEETYNEKMGVLLSKLERLYTELSPLDDNILQLLLDEDDDAYVSEYADIEGYRDKLDEIRQMISNIQIRNEVMEVKRSSISDTQSEANRKYARSPKLELVKFGGEVKDWLQFWSTFKRIHDDEEIDAEDKFQYLIQCTISGSRAREIVTSFPLTASDYPKAIDSLRSRFGRDEVLIEHYIRELLALVIVNTSKKEKTNISFLYDKLESLLGSLESLGMTKDRCGLMLFPMVESCLPEEILRVWLRNQAVISEVDKGSLHSSKFELLLSFLKNEVETEERIGCAQSEFELIKDNLQVKGKEMEAGRKRVRSSSSPFSFKRFRTDSSECVFCRKSHESKNCFLAQQMNLLEKRRKLSERNCCFACLRTGHRGMHCQANIRCHVCGEKHVMVMCPNLDVNKLEDKAN